jgi:CHAD domain-containing protein
MKLPTISTAKTLGDCAYLGIEKHLKKILKHEADVLDDRDPEALHQMRVGMRRLRSAVTGFAPALDLPEAAQEQQIGKIARTLGKLRDLDVLKEALENRYKPNLPREEQKVLAKALAYLDKRRNKALEEVREILQHKSYKQFKQALKAWLEEPKYQAIAQLPIQEVLPDLLLPTVSDFLLHPGWLVATQADQTEIKPLKNLNHEAVEEQIAMHGLVLHELRKEAKRVRYQMELFTNFFGPTYTAFVQDIQNIQEILGQIQDSLVLAEFLADAIDSETTKQLPTLAKQLAETRYEMWQQWQTLQMRYLNSHIRHSFRSELLLPSKEPRNEQVAESSESVNRIVNSAGV